MAPNNANSQLDVNQFSNGVEDVINRASNPNITTILNTPGRILSDRMSLLRETVNKVDKPILKQFANDMLSVLVSWLDDPEVLCCLIHGIWSAYASQNDITGNDPRGQLTLADSDFGKFLDMLITFVDFIIILLTDDIKKLTFFIPDVIKEIFSAIMGAVLLVIQETIFSLRDSVLRVIFDWMDEWDNNGTWAKCLPLKHMIDVLKKYVHDYGALAELMGKIKGFVSGMKGSWSKKLEAVVPNAKDLEFLYWLRDLLIKLKRAVLNFDFCVDYEFVPATGTPSDIGIKEMDRSATLNKFRNPEYDNVGDPNSQQGYTIGADGTILVNKDAVANTANGNYIPRVSNSFLREFIHSQYNLPYDVIDNTLTRGTAADHIQGTNVTSSNVDTIVSRCANTPTAQETLRWMLNLRDRTT
jgi:hypothetical protein